MNTLPRLFHRTSEIERYAYSADLPVWMINWNQAAIYVWGELIQVATDEGKLGSFVNSLATEYKGNTIIRELAGNVATWESTLKQDI